MDMGEVHFLTLSISVDEVQRVLVYIIRSEMHEKDRSGGPRYLLWEVFSRFLFLEALCDTRTLEKTVSKGSRVVQHLRKQFGCRSQF